MNLPTNLPTKLPNSSTNPISTDALTVTEKRVQLSTRMTLFQYVMPIVFGSFVSLGILATLLDGAPLVEFFLPTVFLIATVFWAKRILRFRKMTVDQHNLYVSNYIQEIVVPLHEIERIDWIHRGKNSEAQVHLNVPSLWGSMLAFIPRMQIKAIFHPEHPDVVQLRLLVAAAKQKYAQEQMQKNNPSQSDQP